MILKVSVLWHWPLVLWADVPMGVREVNVCGPDKSIILEGNIDPLSGTYTWVIGPVAASTTAKGLQTTGLLALAGTYLKIDKDPISEKGEIDKDVISEKVHLRIKGQNKVHKVSVTVVDSDELCILDNDVTMMAVTTSDELKKSIVWDLPGRHPVTSVSQYLVMGAISFAPPISVENLIILICLSDHKRFFKPHPQITLR
eukprot:jgi/Psemu1/23362/gm1.23362_g